jgi:starch-binding outer membrane protein, SusD/RagB family
VTNPNERTTDTFWRNQGDASTALNAVYNGLQGTGVFGRWIWLIQDSRTDVGTSRSPWTDLQNWTRTVLVTSNFGPNQEVWNEHYRGIFRANQVIANVPGIEMDEALKRRIVAEAKFIRAVFYNNLALLYANVPIVTEPSTAGDFPETRSQQEVFAQVLKDATEAAADLPPSYTGDDLGRATRGAALALAGQVQLQQRNWVEAIGLFEQVINSNQYRLVPNYADNFTVQGGNNAESVFEVQFGGPSVLAAGTRGLNIAKLVGPPEIGFTDVQPTEWFFQQYFAETGQADPRLDVTVFWNKPGGMDVHGRPFAVRYPDGFKDTGIDETYFWKKWGEYWLPEQDWDAAINYKVIRYADVLLNLAEALNEAGRTAEAAAPLNQVRARVGLPAVPSGSSQAAMRERIEHELLMEFGWENRRLPYLLRHNKFNKDTLLPHDPDFFFFVDGKSEYLPIPQTEIDLNPNVRQNPGW